MIYIGDTKELFFTVSIYPHPKTGSITEYNGTFRIGLLNKNGLVGFIRDLTPVVVSQWNNFVVPLNPNIIPGKYSVFIENVGLESITFELDNMGLYHNSIAWAAANDHLNFIPFLNNINSEYKAVNFKFNNTANNTRLTLRAAALSDITAWIESYILTPIYKN